MEYLTVGTKEILNDLFIPVTDKLVNSVKPYGGLWLTEYDSKYKNYNVWVDFLINNPDILFYKSHSSNIWCQPCSLVTLKENANIFKLESDSSLEYLLNNYQLNNGRFSYQSLSHNYDGIYVDITKLIRNAKHPIITQCIKEYGVSSLLLFNLACIDYYIPGSVLIEPFDLEYYMYENGGYEITHEKVKKKIK